MHPPVTDAELATAILYTTGKPLTVDQIAHSYAVAALSADLWTRDQDQINDAHKTARNTVKAHLRAVRDHYTATGRTRTGARADIRHIFIEDDLIDPDPYNPHDMTAYWNTHTTNLEDDLNDLLHRGQLTRAAINTHPHMHTTQPAPRPAPRPAHRPTQPLTVNVKNQDTDNAWGIPGLGTYLPGIEPIKIDVDAAGYHVNVTLTPVA